MAALLQPVLPDPAPEPAPRVHLRVLEIGRPMTRCECSGVSFAQVAEAMACEGVGASEACRRTGCGQTCGACLPDLQRYLAARS